ncbi:hypothetical protein M885DRAFT_487402 [Pelagophyceae sp. CCMP2097]|nr:hypothetical protein M885DRAFT_487402 [Pelagophyceae sp. CCMP2097]
MSPSVLGRLALVLGVAACRSVYDGLAVRLQSGVVRGAVAGSRAVGGGGGIPRAEFPLTLVPADASAASPAALAAWLATAGDDVEALLRTHGAVLFRGFDLADADAFAEIVEAMGFLEEHDGSASAAPRTRVAHRIFTANEAPPDKVIPFHHEMAQASSWPTHVMFFCEAAPDLGCGGQTPICRSDVALAALTACRPAFVESLRTGVRYRRVVPEFDDASSPQGRGWRALFGVEDRAACEAQLLAQSYDFEWLPGGDVALTTSLLAAVATPDDANDAPAVFFNSVVAAYVGWNDARNVGAEAVLLDGMPLDFADLDAAVRTLDDNAVAFDWQKGDLLVVDNRRTLHSRRPFRGKRRILASLAHVKSRSARNAQETPAGDAAPAD